MLFLFVYLGFAFKRPGPGAAGSALPSGLQSHFYSNGIYKPQRFNRRRLGGGQSIALSSNRMERSARSFERTGRTLAFISVMAGIALAAAKIIVGLAAHSTAVVSDGFETTADVLTSGIVFTGLWVASRPPDENHPYGHGRYETLAGLAVGAVLLVTGGAICWHSFVSMSAPGQVAAFALYPLFAAVVVKVVLATLKFRFGRLISSTALTADAWHDITDLLSTTVALVAVGMSLWDQEKFHKADHLGGMMIGFIVVFVGLRLMRNTADQLTDTMPHDDLLKQIRSVALHVPGAAGIEKCFARRTGFQYHVDLHLEVNPDMTVRQSHEIARQVKEKVKKELDWVADVLVHVEPSPGLEREPQTAGRTRKA